MEFAVVVSLIAVKNGGVGGTKELEKFLVQDLKNYYQKDFKIGYAADAIRLSGAFQKEMAKNHDLFTGRENLSNDKKTEDFGLRLKRAATPENLLAMLQKDGGIKEKGSKEFLDTIASKIGVFPSKNPMPREASQLVINSQLQRFNKK